MGITFIKLFTFENTSLKQVYVLSTFTGEKNEVQKG